MQRSAPLLPPKAALPANEDSLRGFAFAVSAYVLWGFLPLYMKAIAHIPAAEIIAHRIVWSVPIAGLVLIALRRTAELRIALRTPRMLAMAALTAALISLNWGIYVWSIAADRALDAALGYYINPLFSVALGALLLKERMSRPQQIAIALAVAAVGVLTWDAGTVPWASVGLTVSWGFYAFFRKTLPVGPNQGFMLEVLLLMPFAIAYMVWLAITGETHFLAASGSDTVMLLGCGVITAVPLMIYANGAKLLRLSTIAILQYIAPTMIFLIAVFVFDEPFGTARAIAFPMIWTALVLYTGSMVVSARRSRTERRAAR